MKYINENKSVKISVFNNGKNSAKEITIAITPKSNSDFTSQIKEIEKIYIKTLRKYKISSSCVVFKKFFLSDYVNQKILFDNYIKREKETCAVLAIGQTPANGAKIMMLSYHIVEKEPLKKTKKDIGLVVHRNKLEHIWSDSIVAGSKKISCSSFEQTKDIFKTFTKKLERKKITLLDNVIRTWCYVRDIDVNYTGFVEARKDFFNKKGLTKKTHYITSTGIEGQFYNPNINTVIEAYSIKNIDTKQIKFLNAPKYLNSTSEYGVTFERGTSIDYADRRHVFIAGTASIDNSGNILYENDIRKQIKRTVKNISVLLKNAHATMNDLSYLLVYVRDSADIPVVTEYMNKNYGSVPTIILNASVCRPGWLIEMECVAIVKNNNTYLSVF